MSTPINKLPAVGLIAMLGESSRETLGEYGSFHTAEAGTVIIEQGKPHGKLFFALSGKLEARRADGRSRILLGTIAPGEWLGEIDIFDPSSAVCSVVAVDDSQYWVITRESLETFINKNAAAGSMLLIGLASTLGQRIRKLTDKHAATTKSKKSNFIIPSVAAALVAIFIGFFIGSNLSTKPAPKDLPPPSQTTDAEASLHTARELNKNLESKLSAATASLNSQAADLNKVKEEADSLRLKIQESENKKDVVAAPTPDTGTPVAIAPQTPETSFQPASGVAPTTKGPLDFPPEVTLTTATVVPIKVNEKVSGSMKIPVGKKLKVYGVDKTDILVDAGGLESRIPIDNTNFQQALEEANKVALNSKAPTGTTNNSDSDSKKFLIPIAAQIKEVIDKGFFATTPTKEIIFVSLDTPSHVKSNEKWSGDVYPIGFVKRTKKDAQIRNYTPDLKVFLAHRNKPNATIAQVLIIEEPKPQFTFADLENIEKSITPIKVLKEIAERKSAKKAFSDVVLYLHGQTDKWHTASIKAKDLIATGKFNKDQTDWLKQIIMASEILETERYDYFEAAVKSLDHDWLEIKTKETLNGLPGTEAPATE